MITYTSGNLLSSKADALVCTVNTVGIMGKGIALDFKNRFPYNYVQYARACRKGYVKIGHLFIVDNLDKPKWIVNFPTKEHWRNPSKIEWIEDGLVTLKHALKEGALITARSIALPALGCGNGGLDWDDVRPMVEHALRGVEQRVFVYSLED